MLTSRAKFTVAMVWQLTGCTTPQLQERKLQSLQWPERAPQGWYSSFQTKTTWDQHSDWRSTSSCLTLEALKNPLYLAAVPTLNSKHPHISIKHFLFIFRIGITMSLQCFKKKRDQDDYQLSIAVVLALKRPLIRSKQKPISRGYLLTEDTFRKVILWHGFLETADV